MNNMLPMISVPISVQRAELKVNVIAGTRNEMLEILEREYEIARTRITETNDLRILRSYRKRIQTLNNPRGRK